MKKGISIFVGLDHSLEENLEFLRLAKQAGFDRIFTSLHIPEADYKKIITEFKIIISEAQKLNMKIISDISPKAFEFLDIKKNDLNALNNLGIDVIRLDFGFKTSDIAKFTNNSYKMKIEINASTVTESFLKELKHFNANFENIQACHNYYPRLNTGISEDTFKKKNSLLKKYNIEISAFIPSNFNKRGPIYEGLPTLEMHRFMKASVCTKHLYVLGTDNVFFGDSIPSKEEILSVGKLDFKENILPLNIKVFESNDLSKKIISKSYYTNRSDAAEDVIRAEEGRPYLAGISIKPFNNIYRKKGYITVDNEHYLRYMGELQICKKDLPKDERVNVIASIVDEELFLLDYINEEFKFKFTT